MNHFLLVNSQQQDRWHRVLETALNSFGALESVREDTAVTRAIEKSFDIIIVDATVVKRVELLVSRIHVQQPQTRVVVVTASPDWKLARAAFLAGAVDYVFKSSDQDELRETFKEILNTPRHSPSG